MLVLSRNRGESIVIDNQVVVTVVSIRGEKVRLGVEAAERFQFIGWRCMTRFRRQRPS